jgi:alpha-beta hydrolase superfamily lysophospholipase
MPEKIRFKTSDGVEIVGDYYSASTPSNSPLERGRGRYAILLHMMPATKESWKPFAAKLVQKGYDVLAIDERGHGESIMAGKLDYKKFGEAEQQAKIHDVEAAFVFLKERVTPLLSPLEKGGDRGVEESLEARTVLIGASIGANLTIQFLSEHPGISVGVALSPGLNYRGVTTDDKIQRLNPGQKIVLVASDDDDRDSAASCRKLHELNEAQTILIEKKGLGHGTDMFERDPKLMEEIIKNYLSF